MKEDEARDWIARQFGAIALGRLAHFERLLVAENERQNLVSQASLSKIWARHIVDSAQLIDLAPGTGQWVDIGTGGGFPGLIVAILRDAPIILAEPRRRRADFLSTAAADLGLNNVDVRQMRAGALRGLQAMVVSARGVARIDALLCESEGIVDREAVFVFPRGRSGQDELSAIKRTWRGVFHVKQSITDSEAIIIVARGVSKI